MAFGRQVDGFIIQELGMDSERLDLLNKAERPFVVMGGQPVQGVNSVSFNFAGFAKTVADAVCERYGAAVSVVPGGDRLSAFARFGGHIEEQLAKHGMKLRIWDKAFVPGPEWLTEAKREAGDKPLHITLLRGLLPETLHALNSAGLVPGKDADIFYMSSGEDLIMPPQGVKIQHIDNYTLGRRSTQLLLQLIDSKIPATESRSIVIPVVPEV
jgi:DNA-binding LacI/PurR family transcriptional regulator